LGDLKHVNVIRVVDRDGTLHLLERSLTRALEGCEPNIGAQKDLIIGVPPEVVHPVHAVLAALEYLGVEFRVLKRSNDRKQMN
jgi:hypothetical protein